MKKLIIEIEVPEDFDSEQVTIQIQETQEPFKLEIGEITTSDPNADNS